MNNFKLENLWYQLSSFHWRFCHITLLTFAQPILTNLEFVDDLVLKIVSSLMTGTTADDTEELLSRFLDVEGANNLNRNLVLTVLPSSSLEFINWWNGAALLFIPPVLFYADHPQEPPSTPQIWTKTSCVYNRRKQTDNLWWKEFLSTQNCTLMRSKPNGRIAIKFCCLFVRTLFDLFLKLVNMAREK